jgi:hypothetical protein
MNTFVKTATVSLPFSSLLKNLKLIHEKRGVEMYVAKTDSWYLERILVLVAGIFILSSIVLSLIHSPYWLLLGVYVGVSEIMFGLTGFCLTSNILYALGAKPRLKK